jgi:hypothetical protein
VFIWNLGVSYNSSPDWSDSLAQLIAFLCCHNKATERSFCFGFTKTAKQQASQSVKQE